MSDKFKNAARTKRLLILIIAGFFILPGIIKDLQSQDFKIETNNLKKHIEFLASQELEGRFPGTKGDSLAAAYILKEFTDAGLSTSGDYAYQHFDITTGVKKMRTKLKLGDYSAKSDEEFLPFSYSGNGKLESELVFCAYGFAAENDSVVWNDYQNNDINGKWVMLLLGDPDPENISSPFASHSDDRNKAFTAADKGAAGIVFVAGLKYDEKDDFHFTQTMQGQMNIPVIRIKRYLADKILSKSGKSISELEEKISEQKKSLSFNTGEKVYAKILMEHNKVKTQNIIALLNNDKSNEYIVIGAHYDHLGMGGRGSNSRRPDTIVAHIGADDNASGVAAMLEIAKLLSVNKAELNKNYIFVAFGAEEKGLLGSKYFVENPPVPITKIKAMINLDMIGRLKNDKSISIGGTGTATEFERMLNSINNYHDLNLVFSPEGFGPSDHAPFYAKDIPVLFFSTGAHSDYHTPDDIPQKINYPGLSLVSEFVLQVIMQLDNISGILNFTEAGPKTRSVPRHGGTKVTLGLMPDFTATDIKGLRAEVVSPDRPAYKAGMKNGDIITAINGNPVNDIHEYMFRLKSLKPGDLINVDIVRDGEKLVLIIQL